MKKFINKLSNSGNLREEQTYDQEHLDTHFRKPTTLAQDTKDTSEEIKLRKSFSLSKATSPRFRASIETNDDFSPKKKSSTGIKKEVKDNEKLHESDDKAIRKSFSLRGVFNKSSDQISKETVRSPSLKGVFSSYDKVQNRHPAEMDGSDSEEEDQDAFVPHNDKFDEERESLATSPIRVPSAPGRMSSSPTPLSPTRASPSSPPMHLSTSSVRSPNNNTTTLNFTPSSPSSSGLSSSSPIIVPSSPSYPTSPSSLSSPSVKAFTQSPPSNAQAPKIVAVDEFDSHFAFNNNNNNGNINDGFRGRTDSITDDYGSEFGRICPESKVDGDEEGDDIMELGEDSVHVKKSGRFGFGQNKPRKLKA